MEPPPALELPPFSEAFLAEYRIGGVLGEGGMGRVYQARQQRLERDVAIKVLKSMGEAETQRFHREAKVMAGIQHPRVLRVFDSGVDAGISYLVMERLQSGTLEARLRAAPPLTLREALRVCARIADALACAHGQGVVHRDVKPDNVFLLDELEVKLADFGLAREVDGAQITASGMMMGTPDYMAPEQVAALPVGPASDQYALGVVLYRAVTQRFPFTAENPISVAMARLRQPPVAPRAQVPALPASVERVILKMLEEKPHARYDTMAQVHDELERLASELGPEADQAFRPAARVGTRNNPVIKPAPTGEAPASRRTRPEAVVQPGRPRWPVAVGALIFLAGIGAAVAVRSRAVPSPAPSPRVSAAVEEGTGAIEAGRRLLQALETLAPIDRLAELRDVEKRNRNTRGTGRLASLGVEWQQRFDPVVTRVLLKETWQLFEPREDAYMENPDVPAREKLELCNALEDLRFLCLGLAELGLPLPVDRSILRSSSPGLSKHPRVPMDRGAGFHLARHTTGKALKIVIDPDGGPVAPLAEVPYKEPNLIDDHFYVQAVALGGQNYSQSLWETFEKNTAGKRRGDQVEYRYPTPIELPPLEDVRSVAVAAHVDDLDPQNRFEVYADAKIDGKFALRLATFRGRFDDTWLWQDVDPAVLPDRRVFLKVQFRVLPGLKNPYDDSELHQLSLHWRVRRDEKSERNGERD